MRKHINIKSLIILIGFLGVALYRYGSDKDKTKLVSLHGTTMGVIGYSVKYIDADRRDFKNDIDSLLLAFNQSLSTYIPDSEVSRFNRNNALTFESPYFFSVLTASRDMHRLTNGAFDPTVGPLINQWGFGEKKTLIPSQIQVDSLLTLVGFEKISFDAKGLQKSDARVRLNFSAIAKGYAVDLVIIFLMRKGISNAMVEIGGEVRCIGVNQENSPWSIGIDDPVAVSQGARSLKAAVLLQNRSLATSGNYRNFYIKNGKKYAHTISPFSGYPITHNLLSASVFANECMTADALATGMMVLGLEKSINIAEHNDDIDVFLVYNDEHGNVKSYASDGIKGELRLMSEVE